MNPLFEFLKPTDCSSSKSRFFTFILQYYSSVLEPSEWMWKGDCITTLTALEHFSYCLQLEELEDRVEMATVDLHALVGGVDCFTHLNRETFSFYVPQPKHLSTLMGSQLRKALIHQGCVAGDDNAQLPLLPFTRLDKTNCGFPSYKRPLSFFYHNVTFRVPAKGITLNELGIMMLTAQFERRYGVYFVRALMNKVIMNRQFGFIKGTDRRHSFYKGLVDMYSRILRSPEDKNKSDACKATVYDWFAYNMDDADIIPPHFYLTPVHSHRAYDKRPPPLMMQPEEPEPKRQKFDGESALVPEDEFLAQHSGSSTIIRIFVPDIGEVVIRQ